MDVIRAGYHFPSAWYLATHSSPAENLCVSFAGLFVGAASAPWLPVAPLEAPIGEKDAATGAADCWCDEACSRPLPFEEEEDAAGFCCATSSSVSEMRFSSSAFRSSRSCLSGSRVKASMISLSCCSYVARLVGGCKVVRKGEHTSRFSCQ